MWLFNIATGIIVWGCFLHHVYWRGEGDSKVTGTMLASVAALNTLIGILNMP
ncbi:membrane protein [Bacillus phage Chotacabras]|nr:membrane protein [Bacillus phage Chotacabras]